MGGEGGEPCCVSAHTQLPEQNDFQCEDQDDLQICVVVASLAKVYIIGTIYCVRLTPPEHCIVRCKMLSRYSAISVATELIKSIQQDVLQAATSSFSTSNVQV